MRRIRPKTRPRGYALMLVVIYLLLLLSLLGTTFRQLGSALRIEAARSRSILDEQGCLQAAAQVIANLETAGPPTGTMSVTTVSVTLSTGTTRSYQVTMIRSFAPTTQWSVSVAPVPGGA